MLGQSGQNTGKETADKNSAAEEEPNFTRFYEDTGYCAAKRKREPDPPNWVEKLGVFVLLATFCAAIWAAIEADRLAGDTEAATEHSDRIANSNADQTATLYHAWGLFAAAMNRQANSTDQLVTQAQQSAGYSKESAEAAEGQLIEMQAEQRAQIGVTGWRAKQPLAFKDGRAILQFEFDLKNSGHSLAEYVDIHALFYLPKDRFVVRTEEETCRKPKRRLGDGETGFSVLAGDTFSIPYGAAMTADDVTGWGKAYSPVAQKVVPYLVGCVVYFSNGKPHHTPFVFEIDKKANTPGGFDHIDPTKGDIPADQVAFLIPPWYAGKTD